MVNLSRTSSDATKRALLALIFFEENQKVAFKSNRCVFQKEGAVVA